MHRRPFIALWVAALLLCIESRALADKPRFIIVQSTTSTQDSGLFDAILPSVTREAGIEVRVVAVGTGQAAIAAFRIDGQQLYLPNAH